MALCVITWLALTSEPPKTSQIIGWDKANHGLAFFVLAGLGYFSVLQRNMLVWVLLATYGVAIELSQSYLGYRYFEFADMLANCVGIGLFVLCRPLLLRLSLLRNLKHPEIEP
ncbi:MAG: VanZ family protein [Patiriisocius sp.]